uniref:Uncharacterized protein n=1 Tax=Ixodes scapularis TaxID=6945 RepID=A0A4D5RDU6_IXOSC
MSWKSSPMPRGRSFSALSGGALGSPGPSQTSVDETLFFRFWTSTVRRTTFCRRATPASSYSRCRGTRAAQSSERSSSMRSTSASPSTQTTMRGSRLARRTTSTWAPISRRQLRAALRRTKEWRRAIARAQQWSPWGVLPTSAVARFDRRRIPEIRPLQTFVVRGSKRAGALSWTLGEIANYHDCPASCCNPPRSSAGKLRRLPISPSVQLWEPQASLKALSVLSCFCVAPLPLRGACRANLLCTLLIAVFH